MTDNELRNLHTIDQAQAKLRDHMWANVKRGRKVRCLDDRDGAWFLVRGRVYEVDQMQCYEGEWRVCLVGMARAWEVERFELI